MSLTPSTMHLALGDQAPDFNLFDTVSGEHKSLQQLRSNTANVVMFICNHCPFVQHIQQQLVALANDYLPRGVQCIAINANDVENYQEDSPEKMRALAIKYQYPFPYLYDETQAVAKAYHAACTPDFYVFDGNLRCVYRGQLDDSRPGNDIPVTGQDLRQALDQVLTGQPVLLQQKPSIGCNIKWKK